MALADFIFTSNTKYICWQEGYTCITHTSEWINRLKNKNPTHQPGTSEFLGVFLWGNLPGRSWTFLGYQEISADPENIISHLILQSEWLAWKNICRNRITQYVLPDIRCQFCWEKALSFKFPRLVAVVCRITMSTYVYRKVNVISRKWRLPFIAASPFEWMEICTLVNGLCAFKSRTIFWACISKKRLREWAKMTCESLTRMSNSRLFVIDSEETRIKLNIQQQGNG